MRMITTITANCGALKSSFFRCCWLDIKKKNSESLERASRGMTCFLKNRCSPHRRILAKLIFAYFFFFKRHIRLRTHYLAANVKGIFPSLNCAETLPPPPPVPPQPLWGPADRVRPAATNSAASPPTDSRACCRNNCLISVWRAGTA